MFRRKKKKEEVEQAPSAEAASGVVSPEEATPTDVAPGAASSEAAAVDAAPAAAAESGSSFTVVETPTAEIAPGARARGNRVQKVGIVAADKMQKTVVVRVDRQVMHMKYRRYVRRTTRFKAHNDLGAGIGDRVRIVETRPLSAQKRWRVVEILQKAAK
jgi:small subunit ribosomal protein S17